MLRSARAVGGVVLGALLLFSAGISSSTDNGPVTSPEPELGAYRGAGADGASALRRYELWSATTVPIASDFAARDSWASLRGPSWQLRPWRDSGKRLIYALPMFPTGSGSLEACAVGHYDETWSALGTSLVAHELADTTLRPGWEFNGTWFPWAAGNRTPQFVECFRRIVTSMRAVPGQQFTFDWNVTLGGTMPAEQAWPGDAYVDFVGVDVYDQSWAAGTYPYARSATAAEQLAAQRRAWELTLHGGRGLAYWAAFAKAHGKRVSVPEWGLADRYDGHGGKDNPHFVRSMLRWIDDPANNVAYASYFDFDADDGYHRVSRDDPRFAKAAAAYRLELQGINVPPS